MRTVSYTHLDVYKRQGQGIAPESVQVAGASHRQFGKMCIRDRIGNRTRVKIVKNKVAPPFKEAEFDIMYGTGISREGEIWDLAVRLDIINKSGAWFSYNGERLGQGRDNVKVYLQEHPDFANEIDKLIRADAGRLSFARGGKTVAPKKETAAPAAAEPAASPEMCIRDRCISCVRRNT